MNIESYGINIIAIIPQSILLAMSILSIYAMHIGKYTPASRVWQGIGGAIYIFGFAMYVAYEPALLDQIGRGLMWLGMTINFAPRFITTSGDMKWLVKKKGFREVARQFISVHK